MITIIGKKRILFWSVGLLILIMAALMVTGCDTSQKEESATANAKPGFVNSPDAPVSINSINVEKAPLYHEIFIDYTNNTPKIIDQIEFCVLLYDENGNPLVDTHAQSSAKPIICKKQLVPHGLANGKWFVQLGTKNIKAHLVRVTYYDGTAWEDPGLAKWVEAEIAKY